MAIGEVSVKAATGKKIYTQEEAIQASLKYFKGDDLAARVWVNKYALKDSFGNIFELTPDDMHKRLAKEIARIEKRYPNPLTEEEIYDVLKDFKYIVPQGGPMTGIGNDYQIASLSNCFVVGNDGRFRFLWWNYENRPGTGSINETTWWCWSRFITYPSERISGKKLGT